MKETKNFCLVVLLFFMITSVTFAANRKVLILHSYHQTFEWTQEINKGISSTLNSDNTKFDISIEYLDAKRFQSEKLFKLSANLFREKYRNQKFDVIISSDNIALEFMNRYKNDLFPNSPLVFCGVNNYDDSLTANLRNYTGVTEFSDLKETLELALKIFNNSTDALLITDTTITSQRVVDQFLKENDFSFDLKYHIIKNKSNSDIINKVRDLPEKTILLQVGYFINKNGSLESFSQRLKSLSERLDKPLFGVWGIYLGHGIIGGKITIPFKQGEAAAKMALEVINGKKPNNLMIRTDLGNYWGFDEKILKKFGISKSQLPSESIIINLPDAYVEVEKNTIWIIIIVISVMFFVIAFLMLYLLMKRKTEMALILAKENAEQADKMKSEFLAQVSHEIRTPVNVILSFTTILKEEFSNHKDDEVQEIFGYIKKGAQRLTRTIDLILNVAELNTSTSVAEKREIDLNEEIIDQIYKEYSIEAEKKALKIETDLSKNLKKLNVDSGMMKQVLSNLLDNAVKYSNEGTIHIISSTNEQQKVFVSVEDEGIGMSPEFMENIFDSFSQENQGYTRIYEGNGLGLTLCKKYCDLNSAEILVESEKGKGSKFTVVFN